ncbi:MAG: hypothetical protein K9L82_14320 [Chromatiaceae bacterium]|nr:hypothetical protein [Chromatiaceae bacterium]
MRQKTVAVTGLLDVALWGSVERFILGNLAHRADLWHWEYAILCFEMIHDILHDLAKLSIERDWVVTMYSGDEIRAFPDIHLILVTPLHPLVVFVDIVHQLEK